jgi:hypothetical protein
MNNFNFVVARKFIDRITIARLTEKQLKKTLAYLRAKKVIFYDKSHKDHVINVILLPKQKIILLEALKLHYKVPANG